MAEFAEIKNKLIGENQVYGTDSESNQSPREPNQDEIQLEKGLQLLKF